MTRTSTKHDDERLAGLVLQTVLGVQVSNHDDGSRDSMYDLDLVYPDGWTAVAEVVSTRDRDELTFLARVSRLGYVREARLTRLWLIHLATGADVRRAREAVVPLLVELERRGVSHVSQGRFDVLHERLDDISVESCWSHEPTSKHPPGFYLMPGIKGAWEGSGETVERAAAEFMSTVPDVAAKLRASGARERHAVVIVTQDQFEFSFALENGHVPTRPPKLPDGVDCLWLVTLKAPPLQAVYWVAPGPWVGVTLTAEQLGVRVADL